MLVKILNRGNLLPTAVKNKGPFFEKKGLYRIYYIIYLRAGPPIRRYNLVQGTPQVLQLLLFLVYLGVGILK